MSLIASKQKFPEWIFGYHAVAERRVFSVDRFRQRKQRREEDRFFSDLSSSQSPLRSILRDARHQYIEMNKAISRYVILTFPFFASSPVTIGVRRATFACMLANRIFATYKTEQKM